MSRILILTEVEVVTLEPFACNAKLGQMVSPTVEFRTSHSMLLHCSHDSQHDRVHGYGKEVKGPNVEPQQRTIYFLL